MEDDYGSGSLATLIYDYTLDRRIEREIWYWAMQSVHPNYQEYIQSDAWKQKSAEAKERAGHKCQLCNSSDKLETHHRTYDNLGYEEDNDLIVLCHKCHERFSENGKVK